MDVDTSIYCIIGNDKAFQPRDVDDMTGCRAASTIIGYPSDNRFGREIVARHKCAFANSIATRKLEGIIYWMHSSKVVLMDVNCGAIFYVNVVARTGLHCFDSGSFVVKLTMN